MACCSAPYIIGVRWERCFTLSWFQRQRHTELLLHGGKTSPIHHQTSGIQIHVWKSVLGGRRRYQNTSNLSSHCDTKTNPVFILSKNVLGQYANSALEPFLTTRNAHATEIVLYVFLSITCPLIIGSSGVIHFNLNFISSSLNDVNSPAACSISFLN